MGNFRSDRPDFRNRSRDRPNSRFGGRSRGGFGRDRGDFRRSERRPREMHDITCDKCGKQCQVPFRPSGDKPVLCSDCFRNSNDSNTNFGSGNQNKSAQSGISSEQFNQLNSKLDKILLVLQDLELDVDDSEEESEDNEDFDEEDDEDNEEEEDQEDEENDDVNKKDGSEE